MTADTRIGNLMNLITLLRQGGMWLALFSGPHSEKIRRLFGTDLLPTPFTAEFEASRVCAAISALNPTATVMIEANEPERTNG